MMTLDEAIQHCEEKSCNNSECALEHKQLSNWLKELKNLKRNQTQNRWKPSNEQIEVLQKSIKAYNEVSFPTEVRILSSLCNELKKL